MGAGSNDAIKFLRTNISENMRAALVIRVDGKTVYERFAVYTTNGGNAHVHVENQLLAELFSGAGKKVLDESQGIVKVTLYCPWSPCPSCTKILDLQGLKSLSSWKSVRLKLIFDEYYTKDKYLRVNPYSESKSENYWSSEELAQQHYEKIMNSSDSILGEDFRDCMTSRDEFRAQQHEVYKKEYRRLVIKKQGDSSQSGRKFL